MDDHSAACTCGARSKRTIRIPSLLLKLDASVSTLWRLRQTPDFPRPLELRPGAPPVFVEAEIDEWLASRPRLDATRPAPTAEDDLHGEAKDGAERRLSALARGRERLSERRKKETTA